MSPKPVLAALACAGAAAAFSLDFTKVSSGNGPAPFSVAGGAKDDSSDPFGYANLNNASGSDIYVAQLSVAGKTYTVQLDTGSSDLWLDTTGADLSSLTQTGVQTGLTYGDGTVAFGPVYVGNVTFGDFSVSQAFISDPGTNATTNSDNGLLGVGPPSLSAIKDALDNTQFEAQGNTLIDNIFAENSSLPQISTFSLSRSFATGSTDGGTYTIGEVNSTLQSVTSQPKLEVVSQSRWVVLMDGIVVNGQNFSGDSMFSITGQNSGQTLANLDTGTSLAQIPESYADAIYGSVPGAVRFASSGVYSVPCDTQIALSFVFGGVQYPVHPIDTVAATTDDSGNIICYSGFPFSDGSSSSEDFLLGDSLLRNVYQLYSYGSFGTGSSTPFIQLLSTTDVNQAKSEFQSLSQQRNQSLSSASSSSGGGSGSSNGAVVGGSPSVAGVALITLGALLGSFLL